MTSYFLVLRLVRDAKKYSLAITQLTKRKSDGISYAIGIAVLKISFA